LNARSAVLVALALLAGCTPSRRVLDVTEVDRPPDVTSDSLAAEVEQARVRYVPHERPTPDVAPDRAVDILETRLDVRFDLPNRAVNGFAQHTLTPLRDSLGSFYLHAVGMEIAEVTALDGEPRLSHDYDGQRLTITPVHPLRLGDTLTVHVAYTAHPMQTAGQSGLSFSGFGLYFIDPDGTDPFRPTQVWTQGQTEDSRRWFPTWDYPNDKMLFEIAVTVPDAMATFSNGTLVEQVELAGMGLRKDTWRLEPYGQPAYLAAIVAGDFAAVEDTYRRADGTEVPLLYVVEPAYAGRARAIFGETPEMIRVFEEETGVRYPWPNYKQAAVRDFTAGGMENTTLTVLHEGVQTDARGALDYDPRDLIAHELSHQWFGDLVTAEDWAHLTINEGFASYMEEVYIEKTRGRDDAQAHGIADRQAYFEQAEALRRPIVWYGYAQEGEMFDRHTYQKAGQVLNQLRFELGDATWRRGLNRFLTEHAGGNVGVDDLRETMEAVSGKSLRRFFSQWFYQPGHPRLDVEQAFFPGSDLYTVRVTQTQPRAQEPVFHFDVNVELNYPSAPRELRRVRVTSADTTLRFAIAEKPRFVRFDEGNWLLADVALAAPVEELVAMAAEDDEMAGRYDAVEALAALPENPVVRQGLLAALRDPHPLVRERAAQALRTYLRAPGVAEALAPLARGDADARVRATALGVLAETADVGLLESVLLAALADSSYAVAAEAVGLHAGRFPERAYDAFAEAGLFETVSYQGTLEAALVAAVGQLGEERGGAYLLARLAPSNSDDVRSAAAGTLAPLASAHAALREPARTAFREALADRLTDVRLAAARGLGRLGTPEDIPALEARLEEEPDGDVQQAIRTALTQIRSRQSGTQIGRQERP
jgi:aminopeptidase N